MPPANKLLTGPQIRARKSLCEERTKESTGTLQDNQSKGNTERKNPPTSSTRQLSTTLLLSGDKIEHVVEDEKGILPEEIVSHLKDGDKQIKDWQTRGDGGLESATFGIVFYCCNYPYTSSPRLYHGSDKSNMVGGAVEIHRRECPEGDSCLMQMPVNRRLEELKIRADAAEFKRINSKY